MARSIQDIINDRSVPSPNAAKYTFMSANNIADETALYRQYPNFDTELGKKWAQMRGGSGPTIGGGGDNNDKKDGLTAQGFFGDVIKKSGEFLQAFEKQEYFPNIDKEMISVNNVVNTLVDGKGELNKLSVIGKSMIEGAANQLLLYYQQQSSLLEKINGEAGLTGTLSKNFREELTNANPRLLQLGIGFNDLAEAVNRAFENSGRFNLLNQQTLERAGEIALSYVGSLRDLTGMYGEFEKVGLGAANAQERIATAGKEALTLGLRSKTITSELSKNIGKLNEYGFKNGVDGLSSMVRKATEFRMSMESVFTIADKVMNPDGAIELAANLQVLGGAIGDFNDPLKLMYMATNNVEGLQDALIGAASTLTTFNQEQGRFEITGVNLRRAKEMASQLGISYQELAKGAVAAAERSAASSALLARGLNLDKKQEEFITNLAQMKDGKMVIEIGSSESLKKYFDGQSTVKLEELTQEQVNQLIEQQNDLKKLTENEIVRQQATSVENIKRDVNFIAALMRVQAGRLGDDLITELVKISSGGKTGEDIAKQINELSKELGGNLRGGRDIVKSYAKEIYGSAKSLIFDEKKKEEPTNKKSTEKTPVQNATTINVNPQIEQKRKGPSEEDLNRGITDGGNYLNPTTEKTSDNAVKDINKKSEPITLSQSEPLSIRHFDNKPMDVNITNESILMSLNNERNLVYKEPDKKTVDFSSTFEKTLNGLNKEKETELQKVNVQSITDTKNIEINKVNSDNSEKSMLVKNNNQSNTTEENKNVAVVEHKHVIEMKIMPQGPIVDEIARYLYKNPSFVEGLVLTDKREYV